MGASGSVVRRLLITGGTGYLGRAVEALARRQGWSVVAAGSVDADIRDNDAFAALVRRSRPDVIVHTAYEKDTESARAVIEDGSANVAEQAAASGVRLVHVSTDAVFDGRAGRAYTEADDPSPITEYGEAKAEAELAVRRIAPGAAIVRTSLIYGGPGRPPSVHELAADDPAAVFYDDEVRCPVQVDDLADAILGLAATSHAGVLHLAGPEALSRREFAELVVGRQVRGTNAPPDRPLDCRLDIARARALLGFNPRSVSEVFGRTVHNVSDTL